MFGLAVADAQKLTKEQKAYYSGMYCGLCAELGKHGGLYKTALTYDFVLLIAILSDVYRMPLEEEKKRCVTHPVKKHAMCANAFTQYAADMNILLAYYKFADDKADDGSIGAKLKMLCFEHEARIIAEKYKRQSVAIKDCLNALRETEQRNEQNPDIPAGIFGKLMAEIFCLYEDEHAKALSDFGFSLGRAVYLMDACVDLKEDLKKKRYNPLIRTTVDGCEAMLESELGSCIENMQALNLTVSAPVVENILLSGIWSEYENIRLQRRKKSDTKPV